MIKEVFFENICGIKKLFLEYEFFSSDYPVIFVLSDNSGALYFTICVEIRNEQRWIMSKTNFDELILLIENKKTLRELVKSPYDESYLITLDYNSGVYRCSKKLYEEIDELDLPDQGVVLYKGLERHLDFYKELVLKKSFASIIKNFSGPKKRNVMVSTITQLMGKYLTKTDVYSNEKTLYDKSSTSFAEELLESCLTMTEVTVNFNDVLLEVLDEFKPIKRTYYNNYLLTWQLELEKKIDLDNYWVEDIKEDQFHNFKRINVLKQDEKCHAYN